CTRAAVGPECVDSLRCFFFQAEDGIRDRTVTGVQRVLFRSRRELQSKIAEIQLEVRAGKRLRLAASAGASVFPHDGTTYETLLEIGRASCRERAEVTVRGAT